MMLKTVAFSVKSVFWYLKTRADEKGLIPVFWQDLLHCSVHGAAAR